MRIYSSIVAGIGILAMIGFLTQRVRTRRDHRRDQEPPPTLEE